MLRINQIKLPIDHEKKQLEVKIRKILKLNKNTPIDYEIFKRSIDARKKPDLYYVYSVNVHINNEMGLVERLKNKSVMIVEDKVYQVPECGDRILKNRPVVVGAGPAGLFCAYVLCEAGFSPIVIERGMKIEERQKEVARFWKSGILNPNSNVQFGEGGAGTFSDGKLNTAVKDPIGRNRLVLETFVKFGAQSSILYEGKPHIGTDILSNVIINMRNYLIEKGCEFRFETRLSDIIIDGNKITKIVCDDRSMEADVLVLALGHSSRDTFIRLHELGIPMEAKNFAVGFRVEHPQKMIDECMYGSSRIDLPASPYKVTSNFPNGRGVYSFCMCPGGYVVNSSSEQGCTVVNGMSYSKRDGLNANSAIIVSVTPQDFGETDALAGMRYQIQLEEKNYQIGNGRIPQQLFGDFCNNTVSTSYGEFESMTKGDTVFANLRGLMSEDMETSFILGMQHFGHIVPKFDRKDAILSGMETRTSSPIRINRGSGFESEIHGLYPCGEGAGYAGGITSAAMDGIKVAEAIIRKYKPN